ncbi:MAG: 3-oxoacyl-[acyl-carrier-protein] reductase [Pelagibacterales bacterium]|nr:3-oxoacyl-[acyl-carrier-protein] reductase [Pelagibacterales bacterium]OUU62247.1 MAG: 3-oxoacyl-[acyl-carrier-protein] reductase [Alphaproteobacteria bacterium TMED62]|tara:strand:- start:302 stop:1042 length:741 start_codon:yes stop_codon:yes gene_type:complete
MKINIKNQNILVTGASGGIGSSICKIFDGDENNLLITGTNENKLDRFSKELKSNSKFIACDFRDYNNIQKIVNKVNEEFDSKIDILINNAGITRDNLTLRMKEEDWNDVINLNLNSTFFLTKEILKLMVKKKYGRIINISSVVGSSGNLGQANYAASKAGLEGMTKSIALEVASRGITVNCIAPGFIKTAMTSEIIEKNEDKIIQNIPVRRIGSSDDISSLTKFLASDKASYITGQTFHINGGMYM